MALSRLWWLVKSVSALNTSWRPLLKTRKLEAFGSRVAATNKEDGDVSKLGRRDEIVVNVDPG